MVDKKLVPIKIWKERKKNMDKLGLIGGAVIFVAGGFLTLFADIQRIRRPWWHYPFMFLLWWGLPLREYIVPKRFRL